jgi:hypothetical protein
MAPLGNVVFIPGFLGSNIDVVRVILPNTRLWLSFPPILAGLITQLELNADGTAPAGLVFGSQQPTSLLDDYYRPLINRLAQNWLVQPIATDWRKRLATIADALFDEINLLFPNQDFYIVAHSGGGLVARLVWRRAVLAGQQNRIKRIITLGTPHWGSYSAVQVFTRASETFRMLFAASFASSISIEQAIRYATNSDLTDYLDRVVASWPGLYELFPSLGQPGSGDDPLRSAIFQLANWTPINSRVRGAFLTQALATTVLLEQPEAQPPDDVLISIRGLGVATPGTLTQPLQLAAGGGYFTEDGDGTVTARSQRLRSASLDVFSNHNDLPRHPLVLDGIDVWLQVGVAADPPTRLLPGRFVVPGPGDLFFKPTTFDPEFLSTIDFTTPRLPSGNEPRPAYCP